MIFMSRNVVVGGRAEAIRTNYSRYDDQVIEVTGGIVLVDGDDQINVRYILARPDSIYYDQVAEAVQNMPENDLKKQIFNEFPDVITWLPRIKEDLTNADTEPYES